MRVLYKEDPRTIVLLSEGVALGFRLLPPLPLLDRQIAAVEIMPPQSILRAHGYHNLLRREIHGCLGLIQVQGMLFLGVVTRAVSNIARPVAGQTVERIYGVEFLCLLSPEWDLLAQPPPGADSESYRDPQSAQEAAMATHPCEDLRKLLLNGSFYFSNDFDLTSLLQNRGVTNVDSAALTHSQTEYMWNSFMMQELVMFRLNLEPFAREALDNSRIFTLVIRGFAKTVPILPSDSLTIISKQLWKRAGTRYNARGIDDDGNVANFVETELIFENQLKQQVYAFNQIRGSVPAFWEQDSTLINPKITITRSVGATQPIFDKHFGDLNQRYGGVHVVNLLLKTKPAEVSLLRRYLELYRHLTHREDVSFSEFDFHSETKQQGFAAAGKILPLLLDLIEQFGWFLYDGRTDTVVQRQNGVFRTNCLDCLDRTNLIQQVISRELLGHIFGSIGVRQLRLQGFLSIHNDLWADNGDAISQIYTGTNALKSSFLRSGKMNFAGALSDVTKSVSRMYQNTFIDNKKQLLIEVLLGYDANSKAVKIYDPVYETIHEELINRALEYLSESSISLFVGTFNVNAYQGSQNVDLTDWLFPPENIGNNNSHNSNPEIFAIGLQEIIELNAGLILQADGLKATMWTSLIEKQLNSQGENYLLLRTELIALMMVLLFVRKDCVQHIKQVSGSLKKTGLGGIAANKGACAVRFEYGATLIALVTSHLAAGTSATMERYNDYQTIMQGLTFTRNYKLKDHDHVVWFGDLNYRILLPNEQCRSLVEVGAFDELINADQLRQEMRSNVGQLQGPSGNTGGAFSGFLEAPVKFYPTYKFDKGTLNYDTLEKQRVPLWTDRVLYKHKTSKQRFRQLNYGLVMDIMLLDHKPVYATFKGSIDFVDENKKLEIVKLLYKLHEGKNEVLLLDIGFDDFSNNELASDILRLPLVVTSTGRRELQAMSSSSSSSSSLFAQSALQELNLMDANMDPVAPIPTRAAPRRVPPPPTPRRTREVSNESVNSQATSSSPGLPMGFLSTPLVPRLLLATPSSLPQPINSPVTVGKTQRSPVPISKPMAPIIPKKPASLLTQKLGGSTGSATGSATGVEVSSSRSEDEAKRNVPEPPKPRNTATNGLMNDWKPLVPK